MDSYKQEEIIPENAEEQNSEVKMENPEVNNNPIENQSTGVKPKKKVQFKDNENNNNKEYVTDNNEEIEIELIDLFKPGQHFAQHLVSKLRRPSTPAFLTEDYYNSDQKMKPELDNDEHVLIDLLCDELADTSIE